MTIIYPYTEARSDYGKRHALGRYSLQQRKQFCCRCGNEKPLKGGTYPEFKGKGLVTQTGGVIPRFICGDCQQQPKGNP